MKNRRMMTSRIATLLSAAAAFGITASCTSSSGFDPIVVDFSATKTPTPGASPTPLAAASPAEPKPSTRVAPASVPAAELTPPPREKPVLEAPPAPENPVMSSVRDASPQRVVESHRRALIRGDLDGAVAPFASGAEIYQPPDRLVASTPVQLRNRIAAELATSRPTSMGELSVSGNFVTERDAGAGGGFTVYEVRDGKITKIWIFR